MNFAWISCARLGNFNRRVEEHHAKLEKQERREPVKDTSTLTMVIRAIRGVIGLIVPAILAWRVLFNSPDLYAC